MTTFFVGGCMRSGTTMLQAVLCSTEDTNPLIHEAKYVTLLANLHRYEQEMLESHLSHYFDDPGELKNFHAEQMQRFLQHTLKHFHPAAHLVLKNPEMTAMFPEICELVKDAKFIVSVRDPRDTIASMLAVTRRQTELGQVSNLTQMAGDLKKYAAHFNWYYAPLFSSGNSDLREKLLIVKYEDLVADTEATVNAMAEFTGLPLQDFDAAQPWRTLVEFSEEKLTAGTFYSKLLGKPLSKDSIGNHARAFTKEDIQIIEQACRPFMETFRYE